MLRTRLIRGVWPVGAALLAALLAASVTASDATGDWFDAARTIHLALIQFTPFAMAIACWQGGTDPRARAEWTGDTSARGPWPRALLSLAPSLLWPTAVFGTGALVVLATTWPTATAGRPPFLLAAYALLALAAATGAAHVVGALLPQRVVPLPAGAAAVWPYMVTDLDGDVLGFEFPSTRPYTTAEVPQGYQPDYVEPLTPAWLPWVTLAALLLVTATVLALRARQPRLAVLLLVCLAPLALLDPLRTGDVDAGVGTIAVRCSTDVPAVCLSDDRTAYRDELAQVAAHFGQRLSGVRGAPTHYLGTAETLVGDLPAAKGWTMEVSLSATREQRFRIVARYMAGMGCCRSAADQIVVDAVTQWLLPVEYRERRPHPFLRPVISRLDALVPDVRAAWLSRYFAVIWAEESRLPPYPSLPPLPNGTAP
ncbi:hypothetical protein [Streptomyces sp. NPDC002328]|uniref:hypothetical protein n=1 Tax=Streptomyces sp. NPDC002328 TaxID=3364642 RepID=UPI0036B419E0